MHDKLYIIPAKGARATEPFIGDDAQRILITGETGFSLQLLGSGIVQRPGHALNADKFRGGSKQGQTEVTEEDFVIRS